MNKETKHKLSVLCDASVEIFYMSEKEIRAHGAESAHEFCPEGFYAWHCLPGCLPEGDPVFLGTDKIEAVDEAYEYFIDEVD